MSLPRRTLTALIALTLSLPAASAVAAPSTPDSGSRPASTSADSREAAAARSSRAQDTRGALPSLYRGLYFHADQETFRRCVADREGSFTYEVRGGGGDNYYGTYQFHRNFQRGAAYMMANESKRTGDGLRKQALALRYVPINKWSRYWQDRAFYTVLNWRGKWTGKGHWAGGRWSC